MTAGCVARCEPGRSRTTGVHSALMSKEYSAPEADDHGNEYLIERTRGGDILCTSRRDRNRKSLVTRNQRRILMRHERMSLPCPGGGARGRGKKGASGEKSVEPDVETGRRLFIRRFDVLGRKPECVFGGGRRLFGRCRSL